MIAEYLRLRAAPAARRPRPYSAETKALRTVVRTRDDLVDMRVAATNQLAALLDAHWPGAKAIFADVESPIALDVPDPLPDRRPRAATWARSGSPRSASSTATPAAAPAAELLARLRAAPAGTTDQALTEAVRDAVLALVAVLTRARRRASRTSTARAPPTSGSTRTAQIFTSLPRSGQINAAQMLAEWGDCRASLRQPRRRRRPRRRAPRSPRQSGKHRAVHFRWACNKRFRVAITTFADNSRHASPWAAHIYSQRPRPRQGPPPRHPRPGPRLDPRHLALLARRRPLRPRQARRRAASTQQPLVAA